MEQILTKRCERVNALLTSNYGIDTVTGMAIFRVVFGPEQMENRHGIYNDFTPSGIYLRTIEETRLVPKYQYGPVYILERLVVVPEMNEKELPASKLSYEPLYSFKENQDLQPPSIGATRFIIDSVLAVQGHSTLARYKDPVEGLTTAQLYDMRMAEIDEIQKELFGEETAVGDALAFGDGIVVPRNYGDN